MFHKQKYSLSAVSKQYSSLTILFSLLIDVAKMHEQCIWRKGTGAEKSMVAWSRTTVLRTTVAAWL